MSDITINIDSARVEDLDRHAQSRARSRGEMVEAILAAWAASEAGCDPCFKAPRGPSIQVTIDAFMLSAFRGYAAVYGRTLSSLIEVIVCEWLDAQETEPLEVGTVFKWHGPTGWAEFEVMTVQNGERRQLYRWRLLGEDWPVLARLSELASKLRAWKEQGERQVLEAL